MTQKTSNNSFFQRGLKNIAKSSFENDEQFLVIWWSKKHNLPQNHPLLLSMTFEELAIEFFQDQYIKNQERGKEELDDDVRELDESWDGSVSDETEQQVQRMLKKAPKIDLSKYRKEELEDIEDTY